MRPKDNTSSEWQLDDNGRRYRMSGGVKEYEMQIRIDGIEIPQSELTAYHARKKAAEDAKKKTAKETRTTPRKSCPFASGLATQCEYDKCALYSNGCALAHLTPTKATEDKRCPFNAYHICRKDCALFNITGCALTAITEREEN